MWIKSATSLASPTKLSWNCWIAEYSSRINFKMTLRKPQFRSVGLAHHAHAPFRNFGNQFDLVVHIKYIIALRRK